MTKWTKKSPKKDASYQNPIKVMDTSSLEIGKCIWTPDPTRSFKLMKLDRIDGQTLVCGNQSFLIQDCRPWHEESQDHTCDDNTSLVFLDEANIIHNLYRRYIEEEKIFLEDFRLSSKLFL